MTEQKSNLLPLILGFVLVGTVLFLAYNFFYLPWQDYNSQIADWKAKIKSRGSELDQAKKEKAELEKFKEFSLPNDPYLMMQEYQRFLNELATRHNFKVKEVSYRGSSSVKSAKSTVPGNGNKKNESIYTALSFKIDAEANLKDLALMVKEFGDTPLMHKIKAMTVKPKDAESREKEKFRVVVDMDVEAVIVEGAAARSDPLAGVDERVLGMNVLAALYGKPAGIATVPWAIGAIKPTDLLAKAQPTKSKSDLDHLQIAKGNVFLGYVPPPSKVATEKPVKPGKEPTTEEKPEPEDVFPDMRDFYKLALVEKTEDGAEAWLYSPAKDHNIRLRASPGFKNFAISSFTGKEVLMKGEVLRIDYGAVYFLCKGEYFRITGGQSISEAMKRTVPDSELKKLGLLPSKTEPKTEVKAATGVSSPK